uniref:Uncharacterized protein n=1 Tax=Arion vulgaris TaxID=1028688 RepID=A0A0B7BFM2_9EUPU
MEYHLQLELWRGNVAGAIQIARQRNQLSDWIVSMAPLASHDLWELVSSEYAEQLEDDGQYHKAATYLLAAHKVYQAIDLFKRHKLFKEAVSLARIRLSTTDPVLEDLYTDWSQNLMKEGQYEQAAKCYLAMRQIQEASKVLTRRLDQSSLKTACHLSLLGNEKQQGLTLAYKLFNQYLMMGQWQEAQEFIAEHESLKILLPILHVHRLVIQHLTTLCPSMVLTFKQVTPDMFSQWEKTEQNRKKTELPEFLLDKSEIYPVVPWEPFLIEEHTFPHHVLRVWHQHLDITMVTQDLKAMHATISQVMPHRHNMVDLPSLLVLITVDITLCLLSLLTSETSSAIVHLLQAMSTLHQSHHTSLQQALCRLMLPLGPKYLLKLQKEFNASRVLITMESNGDMDKAGGESHNSIKKFLTDIKDDNTISMSSVRCRELDCLRAYCYLSVLDYLGDRLPGPQIENDSLDGMPNGKLNADKKTDIRTNTITENKLPIKMAENPAGSSHGVHPASLNSSDSTISNRDDLEVVHNQNMSSLDQNGKMNQSKSSVSQHFMGNGDRYQVIFDSFSKVSDVKLEIDDKQDRLNVVNTSCNNSAISQELVPSSLSSSQPSLPKSSPVSSSVDPPVPSNIPTLILSPLKRAARDRSSTDALEALSSSYTSSSMKTTADSSGRTPEAMEKLSRIPPEATASPSCQTVGRSHLNYWRLLHLSKGILWDVQAKREALTETLGYIHKAISQHLLFNRSADGNDHCDEDVRDLNPSVNNNSKCLQHAVSTDLEEDGGCHRTRLLSTSPSSHHSEEASLKPEINSAMSEHHTSNIPCQSSRATSSMNSSSLELAKSRTPSTVPLENVAHISLVRSFSENFASLKSTLNASSKLEKSLALQVEQALHGAMKSQPIALQNSRKVLWMDGQETCSHADPTSCDSTFQISKMSPDGSVIPLEWDSLSVDIKYSMPYVTLPLLRQEQESISQELKKVPDSSKIPFPMTATSVKKLVLTSSASHNLSQSEKKISEAAV